MSYIKKHQKLWRNGKIEEAYLAKVHYNSYLNKGALVQEISEKTIASKADVLLVLEAMEEAISANIARVNVIKMEILGSFYPAITAKIVGSPDKVNQFSITDKSVRFAPLQVFREKVKNTGVRLVTSKVYPAEPHPMTKKEKQKE